jgi:hypothetical protein
MSNQPKNSNQKSKVSLSKLAKIRAASYINPHERGAFIRSTLAAENAAYMARFAKNSGSKDTN